MAESTAEFAAVWMERIRLADNYYKAWENRYSIPILEDYYIGEQWADSEVRRYVLNMFYSTIETKLPSLLFDNPNYNVSPKTSSLQTDPEMAFEQANNLELTLNDWIGDEANHFADEVECSIYELFFRFAVVEIDYSADWIDNPKAGKPVLSIGNGRKKKVIRQPEQLPTNERIYIRQIPADRFRVSVGSSRYLDHCDWCGYWEWVRLEDLQSDKNIDLADIEYAGGHLETNPSILSGGEGENFTDVDEKLKQSGDHIKIWKIWDNRSKQKLYFADVQEKLIFKGDFTILPFEELRYRKPRKGFYPLPPSYNWTSPQDEINESREANRNHRRRFRRFYEVDQAVAEDEVSKLINGEDGTIIKVPKVGSIVPIQNADLGASANIALQMSKDDFNVVSGTSAEKRGEADRITATAANITDQYSKIRESREKNLVANYLVRIGKKLVLTAQKKLINPLVVAEPVQPQTDLSLFQEYQPPTSQPKLINPITDFGGDDLEVDVKIQIESISPVAHGEELEKYLLFISMLQQNPIIAMSPILIAELAFRVGYKNTRVIREFQRMAMLQMMGQIEQASGQGQDSMQSESNFQQKKVAQKTPPNQEQVTNQLKGQGIQ